MASLINTQAGVLTRAHLREAGYSSRTISRQVAAGLWLPRGRDVLIHSAAPVDLFTESLACAHRAGPGAVLAGPSAIVVQGLSRERLRVTSSSVRCRGSPVRSMCGLGRASSAVIHRRASNSTESESRAKRTR